jgi:hypothetical protein
MDPQASQGGGAFSWNTLHEEVHDDRRHAAQCRD